MVLKERRADFRGQITFKIKYRILTKEEYERQKNASAPLGDSYVNDIGNIVSNRAIDPLIMDFLVQLDEKIDRVLSLLEKEKGVDSTIQYGHGVDISASGMRVMINTPAKPGDILKGNFILSKNPLVYLDVFGEVVWVDKKMEQEDEFYQLGVRFLDLQLGIKEKIISCIFQKQREDIRKMKNQVSDSQS